MALFTRDLEPWFGLRLSRLMYSSVASENGGWTQAVQYCFSSYLSQWLSRGLEASDHGWFEAANELHDNARVCIHAGCNSACVLYLSPELPGLCVVPIIAQRLFAYLERA